MGMGSPVPAFISGSQAASGMVVDHGETNRNTKEGCTQPVLSKIRQGTNGAEKRAVDIMSTTTALCSLCFEDWVSHHLGRSLELGGTQQMLVFSFLSLPSGPRFFFMCSCSMSTLSPLGQRWPLTVLGFEHYSPSRATLLSSAPL